MAPPTLSLTLLGTFRGRLASGTALTVEKRKAWALLAYLALNPAEAHPRERLSSLLWGDVPDTQARQSLRQVIRSLRAALGRAHEHVLVVRPATLALEARRADVDVWAFQRLAAQGTRSALRRATELYGGDLLDGLAVDAEEYDAWLVAQRERLHRLAAAALSRLLDLELRTGSDDAAMSAAGRLLELDPCDEPAHRALMRLLAKQGRRTAARRQYGLCVEALNREFGIAPSAETEELHRRLLDEKPTSVASSAAGRWAERRDDSEGGPGPLLVGREAELARLRELTCESAAGKARVVAVLGEGGVGKTRLLAEVSREIKAHGGRVLAGHAHESEQILPFAPWIEAIEGAGVLADAGLIAPLPKIAREALGRLFPRLSVDAALPTPEHHRRLFEALSQLVHLIADRPVLILLEDLHWADEMTLRLLAFLARRLRAAPVLLVVTAREEEVPGAVMLRRILGELHREPAFSRLTLPPLSRDETDTLVRDLTPRDVPPAAALLEAVWRASGGNPFVVVETLRSIEHGVSRLDGGSVPVAPRVQELITARLERLPEPARGLLLVAAVIGRPSEFALLQHGSGLDEHAAAQGVELLVQQRFLRVAGDRLELSHDRVRDAVLTMLVPARYAVLHAAVAHSLAHVYEGRLESHHATLAVHARESRLWDMAVEHFRLAAFQAASRSAMREAARSFREALDALERWPDSPARWRTGIDVRLDLRCALHGLGELGEIGAMLDEAETLAHRLGDTRRLAWVNAYRAHERYLVGRPAEGLLLARRARETGSALGDTSLELVAEYSYAMTSCGTGAYKAAAESFTRVVARETTLSDSDFMSWRGIPLGPSQAMLAIVLAHLGEFESGLARGREALAVGEARGTPRAVALATLCLAFVHVTRGDADEALTLLDRGLQVAREWEVHVFASQLRRELGWCLILAGRVSEGVEVSEDARRGAAAINLYQPSFLNRLGEAYLAAGRRHEALDLARQSVALARERGQRGFEAWAQRLLGEIRSEGPTQEAAAAEQHYREALALATQCDMRPLTAHCEAGLGRLARHAGQPDATRHLATAAAMYEAMGMMRWLRPLREELRTGTRSS